MNKISLHQPVDESLRLLVGELIFLHIESECWRWGLFDEGFNGIDEHAEYKIGFVVADTSAPPLFCPKERPEILVDIADLRAEKHDERNQIDR